MVDSGSPYTYLSRQALNALKFNTGESSYIVSINGRSTSVGESTPNFSGINILGMNFLGMVNRL